MHEERRKAFRIETFENAEQETSLNKNNDQTTPNLYKYIYFKGSFFFYIRQ